MKLPPGKIPIEILQNIVFKNLGLNRKEVILGPTAGVDGAVLEIGDQTVIVSMDPITGVVEQIGFEAVNINANDIATFGVQPAFLFSCIMLPEGADSQMIETISTQMDKAAKEHKIAIVGGHCESTPNLTSPIVVCCIIGLTKKGKYVTSKGAKKGDKLILTKSAGIEGTAILATDRETQLSKAINPKKLQSAKKFYKQVSIVKDALTAYQTGGVHAMHDPTEGGILNGIHEIADAANLGLKIFEKEIMIKPETIEICKYFKIDPLQLISSGALLIAADPKATPKIINALKQQDIYATVIGEFNDHPEERTLETRNGKTKTLPKPVTDHLWTALSR
ncbi:MAG: AIR synthase family protein [Candidatus Bathyarchaeota archaeon]|jgi:hydrogenase maturation factor|uniref:AIR synthase family protein n=1 Tax=Candidatus Bathycorpusculum sp. TaxID=2994959 RepID=UPI002832B316|nr:AIR synthase family protein [Candidatus Termiticorpusculum sp.]MCL2257285.1 AIR synthase family protein [Candidatus Termiticorpusculum sp.]MCL2292579.1 AIR synthase family protein [Candidatus Termiticorpusculum sp.]